MSWQRKFNGDHTADADMCEHGLYPLRECFACEKSRADWNESRIAELEAKVEQCSQAWYFPSEDMTQRAIARLVCMCGEQMKFVEPSSRREHRSVNCKCGRRWLWRWTDKNVKGK